MTGTRANENTTTGVGVLLRRWRSARGESQLDLALKAGVSQRHLSFIESGRSVASRRKLLDLADVLDIPLRERNALFLAGGYAPVYPEPAWNDPQMESITAVIQRMLKQQEPFPAVLMDRYWNVIAANDSTPRFFNLFTDMSLRPKPRNLLHLIFDPAGLQPFINDWDKVSSSLLGRIHREAVGHVLDEQTQSLIAALLAYPGAEINGDRRHSPEPLPMIPIGFKKDGAVLNYFSIISTVGTPTTITSQELRIECMYPADDVTEELHLSLSKQWS